MKISSVIITFLLASAIVVAVVRHNTFRELTTSRDSMRTRLQEEASSPLRTKPRETESARTNAELLDRIRETSGDDRELALILGILPDLNNTELVLLIETLEGELEPNPDLRQKIIFVALHLLSSRNPAATLALVLELRKNDNLPPRKLDHSVNYAIRQLAGHDPLAAARWFSAHTDGGDPARLRQTILSSAAKLDLSLALDLVAELKLESENRNDTYGAYRAIGRGMSLQSVDEKIATLRGLSSGHRSTILRSFGSGEFTKDFDASVEWFDRTSLTPEEKGAILTGINYQSMGNEPEKWLDFIVKQKAGETTPVLIQTMGQAINDWAGADFVAAGEWLNRQEDSPAKTQGVSRYIDVIYGSEPKVAAEWLATLPADYTDRKRLASSIHRSLIHQDPEAAAVFAEKFQISK